MYRIGEFSALSKTTIKTLRYYEKEGLLIPSFVDEENGYRFYETEQLIVLSKILSLRQIGVAIKDIKMILEGGNLQELLIMRKEELENEQKSNSNQLSKIKYMLEEKTMKYEVFMKELPNDIVYYKEGKIAKMSEMIDFILSAGRECTALNPNLKCKETNYCFVSYLDHTFPEKDIKVRISEAVDKVGEGNENIKFMQLEPVNAVCLYHRGPYENLPKAYSFIMKYIEENNYEIIDEIRESYIDGMWNKENQSDWLTEIQVPIKI